MRIVLKFCALLLAYIVAGWYGYYLSVSASQAIAVWPAAGVALAGVILLGYRYAPAIALAPCLQMPILGQQLSFSSTLLAIVLGIGAMLQALAGAWACRRFLYFPNALDDYSSIFKLLVIGGILCTTISATVGTTSLVLAGFVPLELAPGQWLVWWIGDSLGVAVFAPIGLLVLGKTIGPHAVSGTRKLSALGMVLIGLVSVTLLYSMANNRDKDQRMAELDKQARSLSHALLAQLQSYEDMLLANEGFFLASDYVSYKEYSTFVTRFISRYPELQALSWNAKVKHSQRISFEKRLREQGFPEFRIYDRVMPGKTQLAAERRFYLPVSYVYPYVGNEAAHGFDVFGPDPTNNNYQQKLLRKAMQTGQTVSTGRISLVQAEDQFGLLVYHPVFEYDAPLPEVLGVTAAMLIVPKMLKQIREQAQEQGLEFILRNRSAGEDEQFMHDSRDSLAQQITLIPDEGSTVISRDISFFDLDLELTVFNNKATSVGYNWVLWGIITVGFFSTAVFSTLTILVTARSDLVKVQVDQKTAELVKVNEELQEFAYRTSHDLRSPLVSSIGLLEETQANIDPADHDSKHMIMLVSRSLKKLDRLVSDIHALTRAQHLDEPNKTVDFERLLVDSLETVSTMTGYDKIDVRTLVDVSDEYQAPISRLKLILENLLSNAVKYRNPDQSESYIDISFRQQNESVLIRISDNGLGIPEKKQERLFKMFERFHPRTSFGSGLGLYMIQKSVVMLGGSVTFKDNDGGASFLVTLPFRREAA